MRLVSLVELTVCWFAWGYPFIVRAPHRQRRESVALPWPTLVGLLFECAAIFLAFAFRLPPGSPPSPARLVAAMLVAPFAPLLAWGAVRHLGRQFRVQAGLYRDHELVRTGPYAVVRHPIYASLLAILLGTLLVLTPWPWIPVSLALFLVGTEIRVRAEDGLLASRFGEEFRRYRTRVPAYLPFVR
jgi:protein-S-isoprenylcysteine O-methyltransferase Ste14